MFVFFIFSPTSPHCQKALPFSLTHISKRMAYLAFTLHMNIQYISRNPIITFFCMLFYQPQHRSLYVLVFFFPPSISHTVPFVWSFFYPQFVPKTHTNVPGMLLY